MATTPGSGATSVYKPEDLPAGPFTITGLCVMGLRTDMAADIPAVFAPLGNLTVLQFSGPTWTDEHLTSAVGVMKGKNVERLEIWKVTDPLVKTVAALRQLGMVKTLELSTSAESGVPLLPVGQIPGVQTLRVGTGLTDQDLAAVPQMGNWPAVFTLRNNAALTDVGIDAIRHDNPKLSMTTIHLQGTQVTAAGVSRLAGRFPRCKIEWNGGTHWPTEKSPNPELVAAEALNPHVSLELVFPDGKRTSGRGRPRCRRGRTPSRQVYVPETSTFPPGFVADVLLPAVAGLDKLPSIGDSYYRMEWTDADVARLAALPTAKSFGSLVTGFRWTPKTLDAIKQMPNLQVASGLADQTGDDTLGRLRELPHLRSLGLVGLGRTGKVTEKGWAAIAALPVPNLGLTNAALDVPAARALGGMPKLEGLTLNGAAVGDAEVAELARSKTISALELDRTAVTDAGLKPLAGMASLRRLRLHETKVTKAGAEQLAKALPKCQITYTGGGINPTEK